MPKFAEKIYSSGTILYVNVPRRVSDAFGGRGFVKIKGTLNGRSFRSALVPTGGRHRLYLNEEMRQAAAVDVGETIELALEADYEAPEMPIPPPLAAALAANRPFKEAWGKLDHARRQEILAELKSAHPQNLKRKVNKLIDRLTQT
jgi:hypothetical protein